MRKIMVFLVALMFLSGCQTLSLSRKNEEPTAHISEETSYIGKEGLFLSFLENFPRDPNNAYNSDEEIVVRVTLENKGAYEAYGNLILQHDENLILEEGDYEQSFDLEGRSFASPKGEKVNFGYKLRPYLFGHTDTMSPEITLIAIYPYKTMAVIPICIDNDPYGELELNGVKKACKSENVEISEGQGAPIAVTKVEPSMGLDDDTVNPKFKIYISNVGGGELYSLNGASNVVEISASLYEQGLECLETELDLTKRSYTTCKLKDPIEGFQAYNSILKVELEYKYRTTERKTIQIKKEK